MRLLPLALLLTLAVGSPAFAVQPDEMLSDQRLEARARDLSRELRCMVCQNQSIDDSDAPLARDLRILVRERLQAGDNDRQIIEFLTARYGEFILLKPRFGPQTVLLWLLPAILLLIGAFGLFVRVRRQRTAGEAEAALTPAERTRLGKLVNSPDE
jgi:cytochrome c-type biogenesis protein CcmH